MKRLLTELKRRHVYRVAIAYAVTAWLLLQLAAIVLPTFGAPQWVLKVLIGVFVVCFPIAVLLAWAFEVTPEGVRHTLPESEEPVPTPARRRAGRRIDFAIIAVLVAAVGVLAWRLTTRPAKIAQPAALSASAAHVPASASHAVALLPQTATVIPAKSIAVLPFENLSADKNNAYFASGMQDLILTKLADIGDLKVIARTSTEHYGSHPENLETVAQQLGVATILEGSVQKAGNQVLINVQLIDAKTDNHLWAESYTRTLDNIFGVEGEVAQKVADALSAKLTSAERDNVAAIPTRNPKAYEAFLKGESLAYKAQDSTQEADYLAADAAYRQAIALDPGFALAYAQLAYNQMDRDWFGEPLSTQELADVKASAERALALAPDLPEAHLALGYYYYWGFRQYDEAAAQFQRALELAPNNLKALTGIAYIDRRRGKFEQALTSFGNALPLAPQDRILLTEYGITNEILRRYGEADQFMSRALAVDPGYANGQDFVVRARLFGFGDVESARAALELGTAWQTEHLGDLGGDVFNLIGPRAYPDLFARQFDAALHAWDSAPTATDEEHRMQRVARVAIQIIAGRETVVRSECEKLKPLLNAELAKSPDSLDALQQMSWVDLCLGRNAEAIAAAQHATEVLPISRDAYFGVFQLEGLAEIEARAGATDDALKLIEQLLAMPAGESMSVARLKLDPLWDPLRNDPHFKGLLAKYANAPATAGSSGTQHE